MPRDSAHAISTDEVLKAYSLGYFPMARSKNDEEVVWVLPQERGVIFLEHARASRSLLRTIKREPYSVTINKAFGRVIEMCAEETHARPDTWINDAIIEVYTELHFQGHAHSIECWDKGELVGGLYGIAMGAVFCGESMFSRKTDASKIAMVHLMARLKIGGFSFIDAQFVNEHLEQFGLIGIPNKDYQHFLAATMKRKADFFAASDQLATTRVLQSITQTS